MNNNKPENFTLDEVVVCPERNAVEARGKVSRLQPKVMEVLCYLAYHYDRVVSTDELMEQVWRGRVVTQGSVQKSINMLRKCLAELMGERDIVVHYSKRGYQLQIQPVFHGGKGKADAVTTVASMAKGHASRLAGLFVVLLGLTVAASYLWSHRDRLLLNASHQTRFETVQGYTSEVGRERAGEPHPNNQHLAYVREPVQEMAPDGLPANGMNSHLVIRNSQGKDWAFASSSGLWVALAWSPSGHQLAAVELLREGEEPWLPGQDAEATQLYDIHVFALDMTGNRVLGKHRLSQWQGRINSLTWWNEDTIELIARQGGSATNQRYRYALNSQRLTMVALPGFVANPLITRVREGKTAMTSLHNGAVRVDFLSEDQQRFASRQLTYSSADVSWLPDGSGVLVYSPEDEALTLVYRNGEVKPLSLSGASDSIISRPRYSGDGQRIFYTEERLQADIWQKPIGGKGVGGKSVQLTDNGYLNSGALFSPSGDKVAYVSVRNNQSQIWLYESGSERQLVASQPDMPISSLRWTLGGQGLIYKTGDLVRLHNLTKATDITLVDEARDFVPLAFFRRDNTLLALRQTGDASNLWWFDLQADREKQLTFGSVGSAIEHYGSIYFSYVGQKGLWVLHDAEGEPERVSSRFEENSRLLHVDGSGIFYLTGGDCRESPVYYLNLQTGLHSAVLLPDSHQQVTTSFHPQQGALYTHCRPAEANIMVLK